MGEDFIEILIKAAKESRGATIDVVLENEYPGVTQEMQDWWGANMHNESRLYQMWHPDHIAAWSNETNDPKNPVRNRSTERIGKYGPSTVCFTPEPDIPFPFKPTYKNHRVMSHYADDGTLLCYTYMEFEEGPKGLRTRSVHRWPAKTPQDLIDAIVKHMKEEAANLPKFLPELYAKEGKKQ